MRSNSDQYFCCISLDETMYEACDWKDVYMLYMFRPACVSLTRLSVLSLFLVRLSVPSLTRLSSVFLLPGSRFFLLPGSQFFQGCQSSFKAVRVLSPTLLSADGDLTKCSLGMKTLQLGSGSPSRSLGLTKKQNKNENGCFWFLPADETFKSIKCL